MDSNFVFVVSMDGTYNAKTIRNPIIDMITIIGVFDNMDDADKAVDDILDEFPDVNRAAIRIDQVRLNNRYGIDYESANNTYFGEINLIF